MFEGLLENFIDILVAILKIGVPSGVQSSYF